jgi:hypothetical protein
MHDVRNIAYRQQGIAGTIEAATSLGGPRLRSRTGILSLALVSTGRLSSQGS